MIAQAEPCSVQVDGEPFFYFEQGKSTRGCIMLLHGFPDTPSSFAPLAAILADQGFRVIRPYLPGYAPSRWSGPFDVASASSRIARFIEVLELRDLHLVGHDWGAILSYALLYQRPELFSASSTISVPHLHFMTQPEQATLPQAWRSSYILFFLLPLLPEALLRWHRSKLVSTLWKRWSPGFRLPDAELEQIHRCLSASGGAPFHYYRSLLPSLRARPKLFGPITVPLLYIHGQDDACIDASYAHGHEEFFSGPYLLQLLPGVGHFVQAEAPEELASLLEDWFAA